MMNYELINQKELPLILKYFPNLTSRQLQQFSLLKDLYFSWNEKINLISRKDIEHLEERHILHSLSIAKIISFKPNTKILDIGTGGGFPGIPLAVFFPESNFHLIDSIGKKIFAVKEIVKSLGLKNISAEQIRAEELKQQYDFAVCRAVAPLTEIAKWMKGKIKKSAIGPPRMLSGTDSVILRSSRQSAINEENKILPNGLICLKGGDLTEEIKHLTPNPSPPQKAGFSTKERGEIKIFNLSDFFEEEFLKTKKIVHVKMN